MSGREENGGGRTFHHDDPGDRMGYTSPPAAASSGRARLGPNDRMGYSQQSASAGRTMNERVGYPGADGPMLYTADHPSPSSSAEDGPMLYTADAMGYPSPPGRSNRASLDTRNERLGYPSPSQEANAFSPRNWANRMTLPFASQGRPTTPRYGTATDRMAPRSSFDDPKRPFPQRDTDHSYQSANIETNQPSNMGHDSRNGNEDGDDHDSSTEDTLESFLPSVWSVPKNHPDVRLENPLRLVGRLPPGTSDSILVVANRSIPMDAITRIAAHGGSARRASHEADLQSPQSSSSNSPANVYYFELTIRLGMTWMGLVPYDEIEGPVTRGRFPGDCSNSIGLSSSGRLLISGVPMTASESSFEGSSTSFGDRDTIGCGIEVTNTARVFFTKNGEMLVPPMKFPEIDFYKHAYLPAVGIAAGGGDIWANFGLTYSFCWKGSDRHIIVSPSAHVGRPSSVTSAESGSGSGLASRQLPGGPRPTTSPRASNSESEASFGNQQRSNEATPQSDFAPYPLPRTNIHNQAVASFPSNDRLMDRGGHDRSKPTQPVLYGKPSNKNVRLDEDFPEEVFPAFPMDDHGVKMPHPEDRLDGEDFPVEAFPAFPMDDHGVKMPHPEDSASEAKKEEEMLKDAMKASLEKPKSKTKGPMLMDPQELEDAAMYARNLHKCCAKEHPDVSMVENLMKLCRSKHAAIVETLGKTKLDDPLLAEPVNELMRLNDDLLDAVNTAEKDVDSRKKPAAIKPPVPGEEMSLPSTVHRSGLEIDSLVRKKDIFSLICMLRAQGDKRLEAALALMRFARDADRSGDSEAKRVRDEIRSSGGMHSLLALVRMRGATRELKVVAALAVAYLLPSFVESDVLPSSNLELKMVECLGFLFASKPVTPKGEIITQEEMCNASAMGVFTFWFNALSPLLSKRTGPVRSFSESSEFELSSSWARPRNLTAQQRVGGGVFDQRQEVLELQELTELTVSLIVEMAKVNDRNVIFAQSRESKLQLRYTLVEQMCAIDVARPIAVRQGLLKVLVGWMKSSDVEKIRCAATSVNELTSTRDKYMAGWIHSEIVNEGALTEIVKLSVSRSVGQDVRLAVAKILSTLCVAPHTRAAVVEAPHCIQCLIALLYVDLGDSSSKKIAFAAGSALLQLMVGAMTRASVFSSANFELDEAASADKRDKVIWDVVDGGAIYQFVTLATSSLRGELRAMAIEALRVISEDIHPSRRTRLRLCEEGAAGALGHVMNDDIEGCSTEDLVRTIYDDSESKSNQPPEADVTKELHQALCAWANILDQPESSSGSGWTMAPSNAFHVETLVSGCIDFVEAGGLRSLLLISKMSSDQPYSQVLADTVKQSDLVVEACRSLASLSALLLTHQAASQGYAAWSTLVLQALISTLRRDNQSDELKDSDLATEIKFDALRGLGMLAKYEPHKMIIIDKFLPFLFHAKTARGDPSDISNAAGQVCLSLGCAEDELAAQVAGNDPKLMGDWFCMQRALLIQSMAREEIRRIVIDIWKQPLADLLKKGSVPSGLGRSTSKDSNGSSGQRSHSGSESGGEIRSLNDIFEVLALGKEGSELRNTILQQYHDVYEHESASTGDDSLLEALRKYGSSDSTGSSLLSSHIYPLDSPSSEKEWILSHRRLLQDGNGESASTDRSANPMSDRVQYLLDCCIPSKLIQHDIMPIFDLRPEASFEFRGLLMPQRRYFSFRREGQLVSRLCDTNAAFIESDDVHWKLGFTNSSFAGEFSETLVQALYRCPLIRGLSFTRNSDWLSIGGAESENEGEDSSGLLANLAGSLPPWVSSITYDNTLSDFALKALTAILETMGKLSAGQEGARDSDQIDPLRDMARNISFGEKQGSFRSFAIRNSPRLSISAWKGFFALLGRSPEHLSPLPLPPLASLQVLDLSGNELDDDACSIVLGRALSQTAECCLEQLDLSRNRIRQGIKVGRVLRRYVKHHRSNQRAGIKVTTGGWKSNLFLLNLGSNDLGAGSLPLEVVDLLKHNALSLKSLDLSSNGLECAEYHFMEVLIHSLQKNTCIRHLNLSGNKFSAQCIDGILNGLTQSQSDSGLAFLHLDNNDPPLTHDQREALNGFVNTSRTCALERYLNDKERWKNGADSLELLSVDGMSTMSTLPEDKPSYASIADESELGELGESARFSDALSASDDGTKRHSIVRSGSGGGKGDNMITVLFSAPLVFTDNDRKLRPFAKLDFDMERELLWQCLKEARRDIELMFDTATPHRLIAAQTKRCSCLHYSGHGHQTHLPFENGKGGPHWLDVKEIRALIEKSQGAPFKFVFVSACHSGLAGETFASAGVPHVVCCQQESELKDSAALAFTRQFYLALAVGHTVKDSFEQGCKAVRATPKLRNAEEEMKKFILLPKDGNHDVPVFHARPVREWPRTREGSSRALVRSKSKRKNLGQMRSIYTSGARSSELSVRNMMQEDPSPTPPQFFIGREVDMFHVLNAILSQRLVSVVGEKGIGRRSLVYGVCHYVNERSSTILEIDRIYYLRAARNRGSDRFLYVLRDFLKIIQDSKPGEKPEDISNLDMEALPNEICKGLNTVKALLVIDGTEFAQGSNETQDLIMFLGILFRETRTKHVRVLLVGSHPLGIPSIGGVTEHPYPLGPLTFHNTVRLFSNLCPHLHTSVERKEFYDRLVTDGDQSDLISSDESASVRTANLFQALGDGIPSRVEKAAYSISSEELALLGWDDQSTG